MSRHTYECHVRFSDVDVYGHVNNVKYFEYFQEARIAFILSLAGGLFDADSSNRQVVARIDVDYKRPILFRAEPYAVETWVTQDRHVVVRPGLPDRGRGGTRLLHRRGRRWSPSTSARSGRVRSPTRSGHGWRAPGDEY